MGSAISVPAAARGHRVALVGTHLDEDIVRSVAGNGHHPRLGLTLPAGVTAHRWTEFGDVMARRPDMLVIGVSSAGIGWVVDRLVEHVREPVPVLMITKGLAADGDGITVLPDTVRRGVRDRGGPDLRIVAVAGPCIAGELAAARDSSVVMTSATREDAEAAAAVLSTGFYHTRSSTDVIGVEVCAAFKNFYALGVGSASGRLERDGAAPNGALAHNLAAALFTQALAEMRVLVTSLGGAPETVAGLAGAGDLYVTCMAGRNSRMGRLLGLGHLYSEAKSNFMAAETVEGAELAVALGPTLRGMLQTGRLPTTELSMMEAILNAVCDDVPLSIPTEHFSSAAR